MDITPVLPIALPNFPLYFERNMKYFAVFKLSFLFIYSAISRGTPNDVLRNPGWETLVQSLNIPSLMLDQKQGY
jgi:hypothetical protein